MTIKELKTLVASVPDDTELLVNVDGLNRKCSSIIVEGKTVINDGNDGEDKTISYNSLIIKAYNSSSYNDR